MEREAQEKMVIKSKGRYLFLDKEEIDLVVADGNYVSVVCGSSTYPVRDSLYDFISRLNSSFFIQISRSVVINVRSISELRNRRSNSMEVKLKNQHTAIWTRNFRHNLGLVLGNKGNGSRLLKIG